MVDIADEFSWDKGCTCIAKCAQLTATLLKFQDDDLGSTFKGSNVNDCQGFCKSIPDCEFISHDVTNKICSFKGSAGRPRKNVKYLSYHKDCSKEITAKFRIEKDCKDGEDDNEYEDDDGTLLIYDAKHKGNVDEYLEKYGYGEKGNKRKKEKKKKKGKKEKKERQKGEYEGDGYGYDGGKERDGDGYDGGKERDGEYYNGGGYPQTDLY